MYMEILGDYDVEDNMYIAVFKVYRDSDTIYTSYVKGKNSKTCTLKGTLGYIRALQHAIAWVGEDRRKLMTIVCRDPKVYELLTSNSKTSHPEVSAIRKQIKGATNVIRLVPGV